MSMLILYYVLENISIRLCFILKIFLRKNYQYDTNHIKSRYLSVKGGVLMQITDVKVRKINAEGRMKAVVSVTFDDCFVVHDIKVIEGQEKLFIAMPSRKTPDGEFKDIAHPINAEMRELLQDTVLAKYEESLNEVAVED